MKAHRGSMSTWGPRGETQELRDGEVPTSQLGKEKFTEFSSGRKRGFSEGALKHK